jgi:hypothetical protein
MHCSLFNCFGTLTIFLSISVVQSSGWGFGWRTRPQSLNNSRTDDKNSKSSPQLNLASNRLPKNDSGEDLMEEFLVVRTTPPNEQQPPTIQELYLELANNEQITDQNQVNEASAPPPSPPNEMTANSKSDMETDHLIVRNPAFPAAPKDNSESNIRISLEGSLPPLNALKAKSARIEAEGNVIELKNDQEPNGPEDGDILIEIRANLNQSTESTKVESDPEIIISIEATSQNPTAPFEVQYETPFTQTSSSSTFISKSNSSGGELTESTSKEEKKTKRRRKSSSEDDQTRSRPMTDCEDREDNDTDSLEEYLTADEGDSNLGDSKHNLTVSGATTLDNLSFCNEVGARLDFLLRALKRLRSESNAVIPPAPPIIIEDGEQCAILRDVADILQGFIERLFEWLANLRIAPPPAEPSPKLERENSSKDPVNDKGKEQTGDGSDNIRDQ